MRGEADLQVTRLSLVTADQLVAKDHSIRQTKPIVDNELRELSPTFSRMYADTGRTFLLTSYNLLECCFSQSSGSL